MYSVCASVLSWGHSESFDQRQRPRWYLGIIQPTRTARVAFRKVSIPVSSLWCPSSKQQSKQHRLLRTSDSVLRTCGVLRTEQLVGDHRTGPGSVASRTDTGEPTKCPRRKSPQGGAKILEYFALRRRLWNSQPRPPAVMIRGGQQLQHLVRLPIRSRGHTKRERREHLGTGLPLERVLAPTTRYRQIRPGDDGGRSFPHAAAPYNMCAVWTAPMTTARRAGRAFASSCELREHRATVVIITAPRPVQRVMVVLYP